MTSCSRSCVTKTWRALALLPLLLSSLPSATRAEVRPAPHRVDAGTTEDKGDRPVGAQLIAGTFESMLYLGGKRLRTEPPPEDPEARALPQVFVASVGARGTDWLIAPLASTRESAVLDTRLDAQGIVVLASYRGRIERHPALTVEAEQEGLVLFRVDWEGVLRWASKVSESKDFKRAVLARDFTSGERLRVEAVATLAVEGGSGMNTLVTADVVATLALDGSDVFTATTNSTTPLCATRCQTGPAMDIACGGVVCEKDPYCCNHAWDQLCVTLADERVDDCPCTHGTSTPGVRLVRGCDPAGCPDDVCDGYGDSYCCNTYWDDLCVSHAASFCY